MSLTLISNWPTRATNHSKPKPGRPSRSAGFTIIEVLIVLAVAGLILVIIFGAIPTLSRSSRNNQRRQDVSNILQAVSHYELNNSAIYPSPPTISASALLQYTHLTYYDPSSSVSVNTLAAGASSPAPTSDVNKVDIYNYQKCSTSDPRYVSNSQGADYSDIVALYALETASGSVVQCQQL